MADLDAMFADLGYTPSVEERASLERSLPVVNAMTDDEYNATLAGAKAKVWASTPWWERVWDRTLDWLLGMPK